MSASIATWLTIAGVLFLLVRDAAHGEARSPALWLPVMWLSITGSRFVSQWMDLGSGAGDNVYEGSPIDAAYFGSLIVVGLLVLLRRQVDISGAIRANAWLAALAAFGLLSVLWSDDPVIAAKRWVKTLGHPVMALIILSEPDPQAAIRTVLKRCAFILLPVSILFIKYLPQYGRGFDVWTGAPFNNGVGLTKNDLGYVCMVCVIGFVWNLLTLRQLADSERRRNEIIVCVAFLAMSIWLLGLAGSATSLATTAVGVAVMLGVGMRFVSRRYFGTLVVVTLIVVLALEASFDLYESIVVMLGRNPTLTDRTVIWSELLAIDDRPLLGYGFESFWLGDRLAILWERWWWRPTQAHNGYLETYLNLGLVGLFLLGGTLLSTFRRISLQLQTDFDFARLRLALLFAIILFNYTEAAFRGVGFIWTVFHIIAMELPAHRVAAAKPTTTLYA